MVNLVHGENIIYARIDWEDYPSDKTPVNERNLNKMDLALHLLDERVIWLNENKFDKIESFKLIKDIDLDEESGIFTITYYDNSTKTIDTILEKIATNWDFDEISQQLIITLDDGTVKRVDLSALITQYEFMTSETISVEKQSDGKVKFMVREGSIQEKHLRPDYLADIRAESAKAQSSVVAASEKAEEASANALLAKSYSDGDTGIREGESTDNSKYYSEQAKKYFDSLSQVEAVIGVKGDAETVYRNGNVNLTPANIGALSTEYVKEHFVPDYVSSAKGNVAAKGWYRIAEAGARYGENSCVISIKRGYNSPAPEYQKVQFMGVYSYQKLVSLVAYSNVHIWTKIRYTRDLENSKEYIELYQDRDTYSNSWLITIEDALSAYSNETLFLYMAVTAIGKLLHLCRLLKQ